MTVIPHLGFIVAAYAIAAIGVAAMIAAVWLDYRDLQAKLARLGDDRETSR